LAATFANRAKTAAQLIALTAVMSITVYLRGIQN